MTRAMRAAGGPAGLAAAAAVFLCVGCKQAEQRIGQSRPLAPEWVLRTPTDTDDLKFYVGRAVAVNALDERRAMNKAMDDAIEQGHWFCNMLQARSEADKGRDDLQR